MVPSLITALTVGLLIRALAPPAARLSRRVRPYAVPARLVSSRGLPAEGAPLVRLMRMTFGPIARRLTTWLDPRGESGLAQRLRHSGLYRSLEEDQAIEAYRIQQLGAASLWTAVGVAVALALSLPGPRALAIGALGLVIGASRNRGRLDRAIRNRRDVMRIEIYTVNQLLAMRVRAGAGVVHAVQQVVARGRGQVVGELSEVLALHRAGMRASEAFGRLAAVTPEPACSRTYALLAAADERGADLASALLELSEDVRETRREALRRAATRRRAAMLVPIIGILAPVMLLFVGAPLPRIVFGFQ
ncbi:MAG TPA: type II secretion system F family protein [Acidimicrobiia bacterium]